MLKRCGRCKTKKPIQDFYKNRQKKDGRQSKCKVCQKKYHNRNWYKKNKKRIIEKNYTRKAKVKRANFKKVLNCIFQKDVWIVVHKTHEFWSSITLQESSVVSNIREGQELDT